MNADAQKCIADALAKALVDAGLYLERGVFVRGNRRGYEVVDLDAAARRTVGIWCSWGWVPSLRGFDPTLGPGDSYLATDGARQAPSSAATTPPTLRLVQENNDHEDDGA